MKTLTREKGQRMWGGGEGGSGGGGGMSASQLASLLSGYAEQSWVEDNYISKEFFSSLFTIHGKDGNTDIEIEPNDTDTTPDSIEALFGLWTERFISAMGKGSAGEGAAMLLSQLLDVTISSPADGQVLTYNATLSKWVNQSQGQGSVTSVKMTVPTGMLVSNLSEQTITGSGTFALAFATGYQAFKPLDYFDANGNAKKANALAVDAQKTVWGQTYLNANGVPQNVSGDMSNVDYLTINNGKAIRFKTANGTADVVLMTFSSGNAFAIGQTGYETTVKGTTIKFAYGPSSSVGMIINSNGNVGIGNSSPQHKLHVTGGIYATSYVSALSDIRMKRIESRFMIDVESIAGASLIRFRWKESLEIDEDLHAGGIAQEWQEILPEAVHKDEDGTLSMDYGLVGMVSAVSLARKVQEQQREIDNLKDRLAKIEHMLGL